MKFKNQVVWITGSSSGLGKALAIKFNQEGAHVILSSRSAEKLNKVQEALPNQNIESFILPFDVRKYNDAPQIFQQAKTLFGKIDILINNAGISQRGLAIETSFEDELRLIETDLIGVLAITKVTLPEIIQQKGQVIVISSVMGKINTKYRTTYAAAKHGVTGYFESLRLEMIEKGVNVCNIIPGFIDTDVAKNSLGVTPEILANSNNKNGLSPEVFAEKAVNAIYNRKGAVYIGKFPEKFAMLLKRFAPKLFDKIIINKKVV